MNLDFNKGDGLIPAIVQDAITQQVLMLGYMNEEAYTATKQTNLVTFYSRSKQRIWVKGETSGNFLTVKDILIDCDNDTLLIKATPKGPTCHTGATSCFNEEESFFLPSLQEIIKQRISDNVAASYTNKLFNRGIAKVAQKVGEEAVETVIEAMRDDIDLFKNEAADLLYHYLILLQAKGVNLQDIEDVLRERHSK